MTAQLDLSDRDVDVTHRWTLNPPTKSAIPTFADAPMLIDWRFADCDLSAHYQESDTPEGLDQVLATAFAATPESVEVFVAKVVDYLAP